MTKMIFYGFLMLLCLVRPNPILEIPIKSLTKSDIIFTEINASSLAQFFTKDDRLDYNQFYVDLTIIGKENFILKLALDTTLNTNIFTRDSCPSCLDDEEASLNFTTSYRGKTFKIGQFSSDVLLNDDSDLILSDFPVNLELLKESDDSEIDPFDGVLGLGLDSFSRIPLPEASRNKSSGVRPSNLLNYLLLNGYIESRKFSFAMYKDPNKTRLILGGYDGTLLKSGFNYHQLSSPKRWALNLTGVSAEGVSIGSEATTLLFDSSVSSLIGPREDVAAIVERVNSLLGKEVCSTEWKYFTRCDCKDLPFFETSLLFEISFNISGRRYPFLLEDLLISYEEDSGECNFALGIYGKKKQWTAGTKFFERYYVMFNAENKEIAIAEVNLDVLMGVWFLSQAELEILSVFGFILLIVSLLYFIYILLKEGRDAKKFVKVSSSDQAEVTYLEDSDIFVIAKAKETEMVEKLPEKMVEKEEKEDKNKEESETSNAV